jgi:hypothetical protein
MKSVIPILLLAFVFGCDTSSNIKSPNKNYFVKYFGGDGNQKAVGLIANDDGTFYILGNSRVSTTALQQVYLAKANALGDTIWQTTYGKNVELDARDFKVANGSIVVVANRKASVASTDSQIQLIQFNLKGDTVQSKILQIDPALSPTPQNVWANSLTLMKDGGFFVSGYTTYVGSNTNFSYDALHIRADNLFNQRLSSSGWTYISGEGTVNYATRAFNVSTDSIYVFGYSNGPSLPSNDEDFWAFRLGSKGAQSKTEVFVVNNSVDELYDALRANQGGYLLTGMAIDNNSQNLSLKISKIRYDNLTFDGKDIQVTYPGRSLGRGNERYATACNSGDGYFVLTNSFNTGGTSDILLLKLDVTLQELWTNPVTLGGDGDDTAAAVAELPDGHIMVLGTMNLGNPPEQFKIALMKLNSTGRLSE